MLTHQRAAGTSSLARERLAASQPWRGFDPAAKNRHWAIPGFIAEELTPEEQSLGVLARLDRLYEMGLIEITEGNAWPTPVRYLATVTGGLPVPPVPLVTPVHGTHDSGGLGVGAVERGPLVNWHDGDVFPAAILS